MVLAIAVLSLGAYALAVRYLGRTNVLSVFLCIAAVLLSGVIFLGGLFQLWSLRLALRPSSFRDGQVWVWPSVWQDAVVAASFAALGAILLSAVFVVRRTNHLTRRCS